MYKRIVSYIIAIALVITGITFVPMSKKVLAVADPSDSGWTLQWSDEFDGNSLNTNTWTYETGTGQNGWGNNELQYYTNRTDNVYVTGGNLNIKAKRESYNGSNFTSGRIISKNKKYFKYGKMEARIKVDGGNQNGVWPAFWMMGNDIDQVGWPACGELDIMEHANSNPYIGGTIHWGTDWQNHTYWGSGNENTDKYYTDNTNNGINGWHTYGVTWDESTIKWYMDNEVYFLANIGPGYNANGYFQKDAFFLLNLAIGGPATGYTNNKGPDDSFQSATMQVDYVRAYKYNGSQPETLYPSGYTEANRGAMYDLDAWSYFFGDDSWGQCKAAYKGGTNLNDFSVYFMKKATTDWGAQIRPNLSLDANTKYNYSFTVDTDAGGNNFLVKYENSGTDKILHNETLTSGTKTYTGTFTTGASTEGRVCFNLWEIASGKTFTVKNFSVWKDGTTTQAPTTQAPTTKAPSGELVANTDVPVDAWGQFGNYYVYTGTWDGNNTAKAGVDPNNANHIVVNKTNTVYNSAWLTQVKMELPTLQGGGDYTYEWPIKAKNSDGTVCSSDGTNGDNNQTPLTGSNQILTGKVEVSNGTTCIVVGMGWVNPSNPVEFFQPTVKDKNGNIVYPAQVTTTPKPTTTKAPTTTPKPTTTKAPTTTPKPTTTQAPTTTPKPTTTQAPTATPKPTTTQAPTTTPKPTTTQAPTTTSKPTTTQAPTTQVPTLAPTTTVNPGSQDPINPIGLSASCTGDNKISVVWGQTQEMVDSGQLYNVYVNGVLREAGTFCRSIDFDDVPAGTCTVKVTAVLNGKESSGVESTFDVTGSGDVTDASTQVPTTSIAPTQEPGTQTPVTQVTTEAPATQATTKAPSGIVPLSKTKVKKATKKKSAKKIKVKLKKAAGAAGYQVKAYKSKKKAKKNKKALATKNVKKVIFTFKSKKFRNKKKIFLRARVFIIKDDTKVYGSWSKIKKVKIK